MLVPALNSCATRQVEPPKVTVAGIEPLRGEGLELRLAVRLRVQNPNDVALDYDGIALEVDVQGREFASGVSDAKGSVPRFGESVITVPVSVSSRALAERALAIVQGQQARLDYLLRGRVGGGPFGPVRFTADGSFDWAILRK